MQTVFEGSFPVHYGQAYVLSSPDDVNSDLADAFTGQQNGLLGASVLGQLWLTTGLHTGRVALQIEKAADSPPVDDRWEEIVEVSFLPTSPRAALTAWGGMSEPIPLQLDEAWYRVRLSASGMQDAREKDTILEDEDTVDEYLLVFWAGAPDRDVVVKQTSSIAAYWHDWARSLRP